jgi:hypothetical protein
VREHGLRFLEAPIAIYWAWSEEVFGDVSDLERELGIAQAHLNPASQGGFSSDRQGVSLRTPRRPQCSHIAFARGAGILPSERFNARASGEPVGSDRGAARFE